MSITSDSKSCVLSSDFSMADDATSLLSSRSISNNQNSNSNGTSSIISLTHLSKYDVPTYRHQMKSATHECIFNLYDNILKPDENFKFPKESKTGRKFLYKWLDQWHWLAYSHTA